MGSTLRCWGSTSSLGLHIVVGPPHRHWASALLSLGLHVVVGPPCRLSLLGVCVVIHRWALQTLRDVVGPSATLFGVLPHHWALRLVVRCMPLLGCRCRHWLLYPVGGWVSSRWALVGFTYTGVVLPSSRAFLVRVVFPLSSWAILHRRCVALVVVGFPSSALLCPRRVA